MPPLMTTPPKTFPLSKLSPKLSKFTNTIGQPKFNPKLKNYENNKNPKTFYMILISNYFSNLRSPSFAIQICILCNLYFFCIHIYIFFNPNIIILSFNTTYLQIIAVNPPYQKSTQNTFSPLRIYVYCISFFLTLKKIYLSIFLQINLTLFSISLQLFFNQSIFTTFSIHKKCPKPPHIHK